MQKKTFVEFAKAMEQRAVLLKEVSTNCLDQVSRNTLYTKYNLCQNMVKTYGHKCYDIEMYDFV